MVVSSDPVLAELAANLLPDLARRAGMELRDPVRLEERSRADLVRYLEHKIDEELPVDEARAIVDSYALFGLVPRDLDLRQVLMGLYTEQVAGFYEPDSTALFVMDDQPEEAIASLLVHELVHAIQDQTADLDALTDPDLGNDRATAAQAAIEGHATLVMFEYLIEQQTGAPVDLSQLPQFVDMLRTGLAAAQSQFPELAGAPRILRESLIFPYVEGALFLAERWAGGDRLVPFGEDLPRSTEEILARGEVGAPIELEVEVRGADIVHEDVLGRLELGILVDEHAGPQAATVADGWDGDRYVLVERADGRRALLAYILWENEAARDRFTAVMTTVLDRFGDVAKLEQLAIAGHAATLVKVGPVTGIDVRASVRTGS